MSNLSCDLNLGLEFFLKKVVVAGVSLENSISLRQYCSKKAKIKKASITKAQVTLTQNSKKQNILSAIKSKTMKTNGLKFSSNLFYKKEILKTKIIILFFTYFFLNQLHIEKTKKCFRLETSRKKL